MQIAIVAKKIGLSVDAIRFYERNGLLPRQPRTQGGSRRYGDTDVETAGFVRRVQGLGFTLSEIRGLLKLRGNRLQPCAPVQQPRSRKARRCTAETQGPSEARARAAIGAPQLQQRTAQGRRSLPDFEREPAQTGE